MVLLKKIFDYFVWLMFFVFLLLGIVIFVTDRTYPGDYLYPFKLKFEGFVLATSKILNKQVDFSIDLVSRRSNEAAKIMASKQGKETLKRLDSQVETTATSISQISDPVEKKKAAKKYIVRLSEASLILSEKQKEFVTPSPHPNQPTTPPESVSQEISNSQQTIEQTIDDMNEIANQPATQNETPTPTSTPQPTSTPVPTSILQPAIHDRNSQNNDNENRVAHEDTPAPTSTPQPTQPTIQESTPMPPTDTPVPVN